MMANIFLYTYLHLYAFFGSGVDPLFNWVYVFLLWSFLYILQNNTSSDGMFYNIFSNLQLLFSFSLKFYYYTPHWKKLNIIYIFIPYSKLHNIVALLCCP